MFGLLGLKGFTRNARVCSSGAKTVFAGQADIAY